MLTHFRPLLAMFIYLHVPITILLVILCDSLFFSWWRVLYLCSLLQILLFPDIAHFHLEKCFLYVLDVFENLRFLWISLMALTMKAAQLILVFGWHNGSLICGSWCLGSIWTTQTSLAWAFWTDRPAPWWHGLLTASWWFLMAFFMALILEVAQGIVFFNWCNASFICAPWNPGPDSFFHTSFLFWSRQFLCIWKTGKRKYTFRDQKQGKPSAV